MQLSSSSLIESDNKIEKGESYGREVYTEDTKERR